MCYLEVCQNAVPATQLNFYFFIILCQCMCCVVNVCCCHSVDKLGGIDLPVDVFIFVYWITITATALSLQVTGCFHCSPWARTRDTKVCIVKIAGVLNCTDKMHFLRPNKWYQSAEEQHCRIELFVKLMIVYWCFMFSLLVFIHRVWKKGATLFFPVTLRNANRFSKFFYRHTLQ